MNYRILFCLVVSLLICWEYTGCSSLSPAISYDAEAQAPAPDYSEASSWLARPDDLNKQVDVFYVYPTIFSEEDHPNMDIRRTDLREKAQLSASSQASVFQDSANLFAPYYRQMSMAMLESGTDMYKNPYFSIGAGDVERAFDYYLEYENPDRPFILAGHSQGTMVLIDLIRKHFDDPELQERLVAAYLIGYSVTQDDLEQYPWLQIAQHSDDTGVIITYNTQSPEATGSPVLLPGAVCVNPLSWTTDTQPADKTLNLGAVFFDNQTGEIKREVLHYTGAAIDPDSGALTTTPPDELDVGSFPAGIYHVYDYAFWYRNLQENVALRVQRYLEKN